MKSTITTIQQAENFIINLKRSDNWVSNDVLFQKLNTSYELILQNKKDELLPYLGVNFSLYYLDIGDYNKSWEFTEVAKKNAIKHTNNARLLDAISLQYRIQRLLGNLEKAQVIVNEQIEIAYKVNDAHQIASAYQNQGVLFHRQKLKKDAIDAFEKSMKFIISSEKTYYIAMFSISYAGVLLDFKEYKKAEKHLQFGFKIAKENNFLLPLALAYSNYGLFYENKNDEKKCVDSFKKCIKLFKEQNNTSNEITAKIMLADTYVRYNRLDEAEQLLKQTIVFSKKNKIKYNLIGIYEALSNLLDKRENYKESLKYYKKLIQIKEEYLSNETDNKIRNLEIAKRIDIINLEKNAAEKMAAVKHDFLANMSHEIRTPINSILGICYLLQQQSLNNIQEDYVNRLKRSGENLLGIINDILDISKIESGKMDLMNDLFSLNEVINDIENMLEPKVKEKKIQFNIINHHKDDINIYGDKIRLYQVLLNIISNAIKFTNVGNVTLSIMKKTVDNQTNTIVFTISDTGIGIEKNKINKIFERYEQADETIKNNFGGTGLGLSISKKIVELMNGTIAIKSKLNKGTQFTLTIPFKLNYTTTSSVNTIKDEVSYERLNNKVIIIADDHDENRLVAKEILSNYNNTIKIIEATDGNEVLKILQKEKPDFLFIDFDMPNLNGIETTQQIRKNKKYDNLKIIGNTASLSTFTQDEFKEIGFDAFLTKPYKVMDFLMSLHNLI